MSTLRAFTLLALSSLIPRVLAAASPRQKLITAYIHSPSACQLGVTANWCSQKQIAAQTGLRPHPHRGDSTVLRCCKALKDFEMHSMMFVAQA